VKALTDGSYIIYGYKAIKVTESYTYGKTTLTDSDFVASGITANPDTFALAKKLDSLNIVVTGWTDAKGNAIESFKFTKDTTIYAICDTIITLYFHTNNAGNHIDERFVSLNDILEEEQLTDLHKDYNS